MYENMLESNHDSVHAHALQCAVGVRHPPEAYASPEPAIVEIEEVVIMY